ncbi:MAG: cadherin repeat domain-containing protein [Flavobacteriaceae bacterium]|uniref:cadherin repeat domain-containing protein n=1 Tax=Flagellimonas sp. SN16 TaxID=3415142 RepID=UPI003C57B088|nr:cadherin repeat domain-containing protein [Flavobacteriaceae bacterium]
MKKVSIVLSVFLITLHFGCRKDDGPEVLDPEITISNFETSVEENPVENQVLGTVSASTNTGTLVFSLTGQTPSGALSINASSGQLTVADPSVFVFETNPTITATVQAKVEDVTKTANITINVTEETLDVANAVIDKAGYTAPEDLIFLYSTDGGDSYSADKPTNLTEGDEILVKISNGIMDISKDDFSFTWITSNPVPQTSDIALAKFVVGSTDLDIKVAVVDKVEILVSDRNTGQFYSLDPSTGDKTDAFKVLLDGEDLVRVRGAIYNYVDRKLYVSTAKFAATKSMLHSVDLATLQATTINSNPDDTWAGLADLIITPEGNILATMSQGQLEGESLITFGTDGTASAPVAFTGADLCCGLGLTYGDTTNEVWVGDSAATIHKSSFNGEISETINLTLENFEYNMPNAYIIKNLVQIDGALYALCYENDNAITHIAKVDLENNTLVHIAQLSNSDATQVNALVFVPAYLF